MGIVTKLVDAILFVFFLSLAIIIPIMDFQAIFPIELYPSAFIDFKQWYIDVTGDYLTKETPKFFVGLIWAELLLVWPTSVLNVVLILSGRKSWMSTTCLIYGASGLTAGVICLPDMVGKASNTMFITYMPYIGSAILAILRGLLTHSDKTTTTDSRHQISAKKVGMKKRA